MVSDASETTDGRALRSERSREAIVRALLELVGEGILRPTAQQVAERAGVGIRTVFRHFSDMETLFEAMAASLRGEGAAFLSEQPPSAGLRERALAFARRRAAFFERIAPYERATILARSRSRFLTQNQAELMRALRADLLRWLPEVEAAPEDVLEALDAAASFAAWDRLRSEQRLGPKRALCALERSIVALTGEI